MENGNWQSQRRLTPRSLKAVRVKLGLNKAQLSRFTDIKIRRVYRMHEGKAEIPVILALLLNGMAERGDVPVVPKWERE